MKINFRIHYHTIPGQHICVGGPAKALGSGDASKAVRLTPINDGNWSATLDIPASATPLEYTYGVLDEQGNCRWEWGGGRKLKVAEPTPPVVFAHDQWRSPSGEERIMYGAAFREVLLKPNAGHRATGSESKQALRFSISMPRIGPRYQACVLGNQAALGLWDQTKPLLLACGNDFPEWAGSIDAAGLSLPIIYKYGIYDTQKKMVATIEDGFDRRIDALPEKDPEYLFIQADESFRYPLGNWKGAGVAVPVFSLRSDASAGIGDFGDLIDFIDWAKQVGMKMVQLLPLNETVASHNWLDSYPYKSISVMALHPIYMDLRQVGALHDKKLMGEISARLMELNAEPHVSFPDVHRIKSRYYKLIYDQEKDATFERKDYKAFFRKNREWLIPYAAFAYLRDKMKSPDFRQWKEYGTYDKAAIEQLCSKESEAWDDIAVHYFIQYHLDKQLRAVSAHARANGIVLKGDIPIGISPDSVEAWTEPHLFNLGAQAGAPPDDFAIKGQNWGFPTYNWEAMAKEDFSWWKKRLHHMGTYFDAYRIDHILGFFRIWEIPLDAVEGVLGYFKPALPMATREIERFGIGFDPERMASPYIREPLLHDLFGESTGEVIKTFLEQTDAGGYRMKKEYDSQLKVNRHFLKGIEEEDLTDENRKTRDGLFDLIANVLFIQTGCDEWHPRISLHSTSSYAELDAHTKQQLDQLYIHFFYKRHDEFWHHKAMEKLPAILSASDMLVCGEDLGMVPGCVPPVMEQLDILSLEIQRMPKDPKVEYAHPSDAPYLSVCTTSTHDMPTIRGWWEADRESIQSFYNNELGLHGTAPYFAEPWVCTKIIAQHLHSPAMWTTFPVQDLLAMDGDLRWDETHEEQINQPSNVRHQWRFRMHQSIEELKQATGFNQSLRALIGDAGRDSDY
ncbi:4-alpha-glucanotransferase [Pontiella desulfatans]|uniref:4-alpha-glucanotransferase n=1 Tax=Pontiella desulfatans TaxID=2750659 RepID=A0A6C2U6K1_PONDE|nr:4-alpha-glucanotransferase [Pontiella desulfatans]VGO15016.1 4-alpha-glucanotransferase [Pontiella desulfatans]